MKSLAVRRIIFHACVICTMICFGLFGVTRLFDLGCRIGYVWVYLCSDGIFTGVSSGWQSWWFLEEAHRKIFFNRNGLSPVHISSQGLDVALRWPFVLLVTVITCLVFKWLNSRRVRQRGAFPIQIVGPREENLTHRDRLHHPGPN
jgi:hypothetical protein